MDKQHLAATIAAILGAIITILHAAGVNTPSVDVNTIAQDAAYVLIVGGTVLAYVRHKVLLKRAIQDVPAPGPEQQQPATPSAPTPEQPQAQAAPTPPAN